MSLDTWTVDSAKPRDLVLEIAIYRFHHRDSTSYIPTPKPQRGWRGRARASNCHNTAPTPECVAINVGAATLPRRLGRGGMVHTATP
jgi:hypothetical protein